MLHNLVLIWFTWVKDGGYWGVFFLMALESTIVPVPSEVIMPPAAYWAAQGHMNFWGVVAAGTFGSYFGSAVSYWVFRLLGERILNILSKTRIIKKEQIEILTEKIQMHGAFGVFVSRLLPVVRHLISMPAGLFKMSFVKFSLVTFVGAGSWCYILSEWGARVIGAHPELLDSPDQMIKVVRSELMSFVLAVCVVGILYVVVKIKLKPKKQTT